MRRMLLSCFAGLALLFSSSAGAAGPAKTKPKKIAESVSTTGFQASVKGDEKKGAGPTSQGSVRPLDSRELRDWFNASSGAVRVISLLSPTCPYCQAGHGVLKT